MSKGNKGFLAVIGTVLLSLAALGSSLASNRAADQMKAGPDSLNSSDKSFIQEALMGGMAEVELGQWAKDHGQNDAVKQFGQRMVDDHTKANVELKGFAARWGLPIPVSLNAKEQGLKDKLSKLSGADFEKQYIRQMVKDHQDDVAAFKKEASQGKNTDLVTWVKQTLPVLQGHLDMARQIETQINPRQASVP